MSVLSRFLFLKKLIKQPTVNASITPSSRFLARAMVADIDRQKMKTIIEFGPGTGIFTKYIIAAAPDDAVVLCIEYEKEYVTMLEKKFGNRIMVAHGSVHDLVAICKRYGVENPDIIISGLPYHVYNTELMQLLQGYISQGTVFRGFSYTPHQFRDVYKDMKLEQKSFVVRNIPPAFVFGAN